MIPQGIGWGDVQHMSSERLQVQSSQKPYFKTLLFCHPSHPSRCEMEIKSFLIGIMRQPADVKQLASWMWNFCGTLDLCPHQINGGLQTWWSRLHWNFAHIKSLLRRASWINEIAEGRRSVWCLISAVDLCKSCSFFDLSTLVRSRYSAIQFSCKKMVEAVNALGKESHASLMAWMSKPASP